MTVDWTEPARDDLRAIRQYLEQHSPEQADATVRGLVDHAARAALFPRSGRIVPEFGVELIRELIAAPYRIVYEVFPDRVEILAVFHGAQSFPR